jgi:hypothetical protein
VPSGLSTDTQRRGDLHDRRLHGHRAGSDVVGVELTEANPGSLAGQLIPGRGSCTGLTQYRMSEMTVIMCTSAVTVFPVRVMIAQQIPLGSRWPIARRGDCYPIPAHCRVPSDVIVAAGVITFRYNWT